MGGADELARVFGEQVSTQPERFALLALTFDDEMPTAASRAVIGNISSSVDIHVLEDVCVHAAAVAGSEVGRSICSAIEKRAGEATDRSLALLATYSSDPDPDQESARTASWSGELFYNGDLAMAGLNSTRGHVAHAAAAILIGNPDYTDFLVPIVEKLAGDQFMAVRVSAAEAILPLISNRSDKALDVAEQLLSTTASDIYEAPAVERLLIYCLMRDPARFAAELHRALAANHRAAETGGVAWAIMALRETIPPGVPGDVTELSDDARKGAASVFGANPSDAGQVLRVLFDDPNVAVRNEAASAMRNLDEVPLEQRDDLIRAFLASAAFNDEFEGLVHALERLTTTLPTSAIEAMERVVAVADRDLADFRTSRAAVSRDLISVVLRLYRQGHQGLRVRSLNVIDRLAEVGAYGLNDALERER